MLAILGAGMVPATGCLSGTPESGSDTTDSPQTDADGSPSGTATPLPPGSVDFPDGPKAPPERPSSLTESTVRNYVRAHEYRYAYNSLWVNEHSDVELDCRVDSVADRQWGYEAVVTCTGYSNTDPPEDSTATPGPHADWFTQSFRYRVSENATHRLRVDNRDPVS